ncbi:MAG: DUF1428 domain-containing protein [Thiolinea sp.]
MSYVDGFVLPAPIDRLDEYRKMAQSAGEIWMEHGALAYKECVGDDLNSEFAGGSFPKIAGAQEGETVVFAFIIYKDRAHRDEVNTKVHQDPRMQCGDMNDLPFDCNRMNYGGFTTLVDL